MGQATDSTGVHGLLKHSFDSYLHDKQGRDGGAIWGDGDISVTRSLFCRNQSNGSGGIWSDEGGHSTAWFTNNIFYDTQDNIDGGLVFLDDGNSLDFRQNAVVGTQACGYIAWTVMTPSSPPSRGRTRSATAPSSAYSP